MRTITLFLASILTFTFAGAYAETAQETAVRKRIDPHLSNTEKIESVTKMPYLDLYEIRLDNDILYTDEQAQYFFSGHILEVKNHRDLTQARLDEMNKIKITDLPLESAIKTVKGNGKRIIVTFEDPNCGYCKRLRQTLQNVDNLTTYTFMYNILSEDSSIKSRNIWCSADRNKAWDDWMLRGKAAAAAPANCTGPNNQVSQLGKKLKITGTPAIFFADGSRTPGAISAKELEARLATIK